MGLVVLFALFYLVLKLLRRPILSRLCASIAILVLLLSTNPLFANYLVRSLEKRYPQTAIENIGVHDIIVVLGGGLRLPQPPARHVQLTKGSDRYWYATQLYRAGKAQRIVISGGNLVDQNGLESESVYAKKLLIEWGVPEEAVLVESLSRTTKQNRDEIMALIAEQEISSALLVTSAWHMPRAYNLFKELPLASTPASADVLVRQSTVPKIFNWLPSADALTLSTLAAHEYYGMWFNFIVEESKVLDFNFWCSSCSTQRKNSLFN